MSGGADSLKLKLKLPPSLSASLLGDSEQHAPLDEASLLIGARGGAAVKELLTTAPNIEVAIRDFQTAHGVAAAHAQIVARKRAKCGKTDDMRSLAPPVQLLDLLSVRRSTMYSSLLNNMLQEMLLRIQELPQSELQRVLEATFPYIEFRELRAIPIAILSRQEDTPEAYLRELTENRRILAELPIHVRRKILQVDRQELQLFVEECTKDYVEDQVAWYMTHPSTGSKGASQLRRRNSGTLLRKRSSSELGTDNLWNVSSHVPTSAGSSSPSPSAAVSGERRPSYSPDDRRHHSAALVKLTEMLGDSEELYRSTLEIWKEYVVTASIPGGESSANSKEYVDYVPFLGAMRADLANLQRDKTTSLLRADPLHKFIWFLDRALKSHTLEIAQLHELLGFVGKLRTGDLPPNKKFKKTANGGEVQEEEENFEVVLGPPPVEELLSVLDKIAKVDVRMIFAEPVPDDVPKYREIIKEPMDLSTMRKKAKKGKYKTLEMFTEDFNLMIRNCLTFNPDTTVFYKEGKRIGKRGIELIEKNSAALRGEPQRIRAKKRRKSGPGEAVAMLTSSGVASLKDFGDVDQSGMVLEGICEEALADVAMILSDPYVKQLLCDALMRKLVICWQKKELPTDNLTCRALVQLLQIGNPSSVRRMIRKNDYVLRAPQVVTMRVALPLVLRSMVTFGVLNGFSDSPTDAKAQEEILNPVLWENVLRASSAIRALTKSFAVQCLVDHQFETCAKLLQYLVAAEDYLLLRDRVLLHAVGEATIEQLRTAIAALNAAGNGGVGGTNGSIAEAKESGEVVADLRDRVEEVSVFRLIVSGFFVNVLSLRSRLAMQTNEFAIEIADSTDGVDEHTGDKLPLQQEKVIVSFPVQVFHEKTVMILAAVAEMLEKVDAAKVESVLAPYLKKTIGELRDCSSLEAFEMLWDSSVFAVCRKYYDGILGKCPRLRAELFRPDEKKTVSSDGADEPSAADATEEKEIEESAPVSDAVEPVEEAKASLEVAESAETIADKNEVTEAPVEVGESTDTNMDNSEAAPNGTEKVEEEPVDTPTAEEAQVEANDE